jgi:hypothetical protein
MATEVTQNRLSEAMGRLKDGYDRGMSSYNKPDGVAEVPRLTICEFVQLCLSTKAGNQEILQEVRMRFCLHWTIIGKTGPQETRYSDISLKRLTEEQMMELGRGGQVSIRVGLLFRKTVRGDFWIFRFGREDI